MYGLLCIRKIIKSTQKCDLGSRPYLPHLACKLDAADKWHAYIRQKQIRLQLFRQFQSFRTVFRLSDHLKTDASPVYFPDPVVSTVLSSPVESGQPNGPFGNFFPNFVSVKHQSVSFVFGE